MPKPFQTLLAILLAAFLLLTSSAAHPSRASYSSSTSRLGIDAYTQDSLAVNHALKPISPEEAGDRAKATTTTSTAECPTSDGKIYLPLILR